MADGTRNTRVYGSGQDQVRPDGSPADGRSFLCVDPALLGDEPALAPPLKFPVIDPSTPAEVPPVPRASHRRVHLLVVALVVTALLAAGFGGALWVRSALPLALVFVAVALTFRARRAQADELARAALKSPAAGAADELDTAELPAKRALVLSPGALSIERIRGDRTSLPTALPIKDRFGLTLLSSHRRDRLVAAITSDEGSFLFATTVSDRTVLAELLARSTILGEDDILDATGPDGAPIHLEEQDFHELVSALRARDAGCMDRIVLSDQHGAALVLDAGDLYIKDTHFDLRRPLEWRPILFQEAFGASVTRFQGTWLRQNNAEMVLVSVLPFFESTLFEVEKVGVPELDAMAVRDQRLLQAAPTDPPPVEQRIAMDRMFVIPFRAVLDRAPRATTQPARAGHPD